MALHFSFRKKNKGAIHVCPQRSLCLKQLYQNGMKVILQVQMRTSGKISVYGHFPGRALRLMVSWPGWTAKLYGVKANEVKLMVIEHTVRPASNQRAPDDAPEFALAPTTYNRKRNLIVSIIQIIF